VTSLDFLLDIRSVGGEVSRRLVGADDRLEHAGKLERKLRIGQAAQDLW
jgi:hypothetical protein